MELPVGQSCVRANCKLRSAAELRRLSRMGLRHLSVFLVVLCALGSVGQEVGGKDGEVEALLRQLGAEKFADREEATRKLWERGYSVIPTLQAAAKGGDPEVAKRARRVLKDLEMGILADTPVDWIATIRRYHAANRTERMKILTKLQGADDIRLRYYLMRSEKDAEFQAQLFSRYSKTGDQYYEELAGTNQLDHLPEILAVKSPRNWAVYQFLTGRLKEELERLQGENEGIMADPRFRAWLLILDGDLERARELAETLNDENLRREVYIRQEDWEALLELPVPLPGTNVVEREGFAAMIRERAGHPVDDGIKRLKELKLENPILNRLVANYLIVLDAPNVVADYLSAQGQLTTDEIDFHLEQLNFGAFFGRLGVNGPSDDVVGGFKKLTENGKARENYRLARAVAEAMARFGELKQARQLYQIALELGGENSSVPGELASSAYRMGMHKLAREYALLALDDSAATYYLRRRFHVDSSFADTCWRYLRAKHQAESPLQVLGRLEELLEPGGKPRTAFSDDILVPILKWAGEEGGNDLARVLGDVGMRYREQGSLEEAEECFRKQAKRALLPAAALLNAGQLAGKDGRWEDAVVFYRDAAKKESIWKEFAMYLHGHALTQAGHVEDGEKLQQEARLMPVENTLRRYYFAQRLWLWGLREEALRQWDLVELFETRTQRKGSSGLVSTRAQLVRFAKDPVVAAGIQSRLVFRGVGTSRAQTVRDALVSSAQLHILQMREAFQGGQAAEVHHHLQRALALRAGMTDPAVEGMEMLELLGQQEKGEKLYREMEARLRGALKLVPNSAREHNGLAWFMAIAGRNLEEAQKLSEHSLRLAPDNYHYLDTLAEIHFRLGNRDLAVELSERALELTHEKEIYRERLQRFRGEDQF